MKKINIYLLVSIIALFLLCPQLLNAQKNGKKVKTTSGKTIPKPKIAPKPAPVTKQVNTEPTEAEMKEALLKGMEERGGKRTADDSIEVNNAIAGSIVKIERFEKLGCAPVTYGVGYACIYKATTSMSVRSNDGTSDGDRQAKVWNILLGGMGAKYATATATRRFVRGKNGWTIIDD